MRKAAYVAALILSVLVLFLSVAGIIGVWIAEAQVSRASVEMLNAIDRTAQAARDALVRVDARVSTARESVQSVGAAAETVSQNVGDRGLILTLLPQEKEQQIEAAAEDLRDSFAGIRESVLATLAVIRAVDDLPFVTLPGPDPAQVEQVGSSLEALQTEVANLNAEISAFRDSTAGSISRVKDAADRVDNRLERIDASLAEVDARLVAVQDRTRRLSQTIPVTLFVIASVSTALLLWVAFTQFLVAREAWVRVKTPTDTTRRG